MQPLSAWSGASAPANLERERSLFQRREWEKRRQGWARTLLFDVGWRAPREDLKAAAAVRHPQMADAERVQLVDRAIELQRGEIKKRPLSATATHEPEVEQPVEEISNAGKNGPKLTVAEREQVRALIRRELKADAAVKAAAVQRMVATELGITFNHTTFHAVYWRKVKEKMKNRSNGTAEPSSGNSVAEPALPRDKPATPVMVPASGEHLTLTPGPDGQWTVRMDLQVPREMAMQIVQAVAKLLATEEAE